MKLVLENGKYEVDTNTLQVLRHGEPWRDIIQTGDKFQMVLVAELERLKSAHNTSRRQLELQKAVMESEWAQDQYMQGMYNGMELILSYLEDREPVFKNAKEIGHLLEGGYQG